jgi:hypothetical protein
VFAACFWRVEEVFLVVSVNFHEFGLFRYPRPSAQVVSAGQFLPAASFGRQQRTPCFLRAGHALIAKPRLHMTAFAGLCLFCCCNATFQTSLSPVCCCCFSRAWPSCLNQRKLRICSVNHKRQHPICFSGTSWCPSAMSMQQQFSSLVCPWLLSKGSMPLLTCCMLSSSAPTARVRF